MYNPARSSLAHFSRSARALHTSRARHAITNFAMPAMSPTMTEGAIAEWKKNEGEPFAAGDILLEIETDKATIDVEAQEDGVLGKILAQNGAKNIPVGKTIALLAEDGDDISNLEAPKEEEITKAAPTPVKQEAVSTAVPTPEPPAAPPSPPTHSHTPKHARPLFPSVLRILVENNVEDASKIKGTGVRGMLTKGDVLAFLGKASSPTGTFKETAEPNAVAPKKEELTLDGAAIRKLIVSGLVQSTTRRPVTPPPVHSFNSIIADYLPPVPAKAPQDVAPPTPRAPVTSSYFDGLL